MNRKNNLLQIIKKINNDYNFNAITNIISILVFLGTFLSIGIQLIYYYSFNLKTMIYGINDKSLFSFNFFEFLILIILSVFLIFISFIFNKIHNSNNYKKIKKIIIYIIILIFASLFLIFVPCNNIYSGTNMQSKLLNQFIINSVIIITWIYSFGYIKKQFLSLIYEETNEIKTAKNPFLEAIIRIMCFILCCGITLGPLIFIFEKSKKQYLFTEENEIIIYSNSEKYIVMPGSYNKKKNIYTYIYGNYKIVSKDSLEVRSHIFNKVKVKNSVGGVVLHYFCWIS